MAFKCKIGFHTWNGCKCTDCGKTRDEQHEWSKDNKKCLKCGNINVDNIKTIKIGNQEWMLENLNVTIFRNGEKIQEAGSIVEFKKAGIEKKPVWCVYNNDPNKGEKYGKLYNWYAVNDPRGLAPKGFHVPNEAEWTILTTYLGDTPGSELKSTSDWSYPNTGATNSSGFAGLPGGYRGLDGKFYEVGERGSWWSSSVHNATHAWGRELYYDLREVGQGNMQKNSGWSVRCIKDL